MLKYLVMFLCLFCFSCATQPGKYAPNNNKNIAVSNTSAGTVEIYNKYHTKSPLNMLGNSMPEPDLDIRPDEPLIITINPQLQSFQTNNRKLLYKNFKLFLPKLKIIRFTDNMDLKVVKNEELMLARKNEEIKNLKKNPPPIKLAGKKKRTLLRTKPSSSKTARKSAKTNVTPILKQKTSTDAIKTKTYAKPYKNIISRENDSIIISFKGLGWVYEGTDNMPAPTDGIEYKGKDYSNNKTSFTFKAHKIGVYLLKFIKQDNNTATSINRNIKVQVVKDADFSKMLTAGNNTSRLENANFQADYTIPDDLYKSGDFKDALREYLRIYNSNDPYLNERIAHLYFNEKEYEAALKYWKLNLQPDNEYYREAMEGTLLCAVKLDDIVEVSKTIENYKNILDKSNSLKEEDNLFAAAKTLYKNNRTKFAIELLNTYIKNYLKGRYIDAVYFYLGSLYENDKGIRDLKKSLMFYEKVYNDYTGSAYYTRAYERINYIRRHFFDIR